MLEKFLEKITDKKHRRNREARRNLAVLFALFFAFIYFPFYSNTSNQGILAFYDHVYRLIDPFLMASFLVGLMSLYVNGKYDSKALKAIFTLFFLLSLAFASFFAFGLSSPYELVVFSGHALVLVLHFAVWFYESKKK